MCPCIWAICCNVGKFETSNNSQGIASLLTSHAEHNHQPSQVDEVGYPPLQGLVNNIYHFIIFNKQQTSMDNFFRASKAPQKQKGETVTAGRIINIIYWQVIFVTNNHPRLIYCYLKSILLFRVSQFLPNISSFSRIPSRISHSLYLSWLLRLLLAVDNFSEFSYFQDSFQMYQPGIFQDACHSFGIFMMFFS